MANWMVFCVLAAGMSGPSLQRLDWETDYGKALQATRVHSKPLLIVLDNPTDQAARIQPARLRPDDTGRELLRPYQLCHVDVSTSYGQEVAKAFKAQQFPYTAIIDRGGKRIIYRKSGPFSTTDWAATLLAYKEGKDPSECFT